MKKLFKIALIVFAAGVLVAGGVIYYVFNKPHRNLEKETPAFILNASDFYTEFSSDEEVSYTKYGNKAIQVTGVIADVSVDDNSASIILLDEMEGINCGFDSLGVSKYKLDLSKLSTGNKITIKGQCDGYDMIMGVVLTRCVIVKE